METNIVKIYKERDFVHWIKQFAVIGKIYIAGAGSYGKVIGEFLKKNNIYWDGYFDKDEHKNILLGKRVEPYSNLTRYDNVYVVISSNTLCNDIYKEIKKYGLPDENICIVVEKGYMLLTNDIDKRILQYKDKYLGERCFIVCNGPSLSIEDLNRIKNEYSFGCNCIFGVFSATEWRPNFYCTLDGLVIEYLYTALRGKAINWQCSMFSLKNEISVYDTKHDFIVCNAVDDLDRKTGMPKFSSDCSKYVYTVGTVTYYMLQLAVYMGFKEIILLGMDFNFSVERYNDGRTVKKNIANHMKLIDEAQPSENSAIMQRAKKIDGDYYVGYIDKQYDGFLVAKKYAEKHGIEIFNASRQTKLDVFKCVNLEDIL